MNIHAADAAISTATAPPPNARRTLLRKYFTLFVAIVSVALIVNGAFEVWFGYQEQKMLLIRLQRQQAEAAAEKISGFIKEVEGYIEWSTKLSSDNLDERRIDAVRVLRQMKLIAELAQIDSEGREKLSVSQIRPDRLDSETDVSQETWFKQALENGVYYGPVEFLGDSEPHMDIAMAGGRSGFAVSRAEIRLNFLWDVVTQIKIGAKGQAYVVDGAGRLISHPDMSLVLSNTDLSTLPHVQAALHGGSQPSDAIQLPDGRRVLAAYAPVAPVGWLVFAELPTAEAYYSIYASIARSGLLLLAGLALAFLASWFLARNMVRPIRALSRVAASIGSGDLGRRIAIHSGDELEALGHQFNSMAVRLQDSYATLERKVEERTHQLELANLAKSRFLAAASHDLRQPLHALGLFVGQLHTEPDAAERRRILERIDAAIAAMKKLFSALLDISKLDAGLRPDVVEFPIARLLAQTETTFGETASEKGLKLRVVSSSLWARSDAILLERILLNLVTNAVRYTDRGGVLVGCRRRGKRLRIEVWDSGPGIPEDQRRKIFDEFYQLPGPGHDRRGGLGLGLAIVDRLCRLLDHPIDLTSTLGKGSCFAVEVPLADGRANRAAAPVARPATTDVAVGKLVVVIDDDTLVLDATVGLLRAWGCLVVVADSPDAALACLADGNRVPDLIICDYRLSGGESGIEAIERVRRALQATVPAFLISGDTASERLIEARASGHHLLHKPLHPMRLRSLINQLLKKADATP